MDGPIEGRPGARVQWFGARLDPGALGRREALAQSLAVLLAAGSLVLAPRRTEAQAPAKIPRVGVVGPRTAADGGPYIASLQQGLRDLGWVEGRTIATEVRWAEGRADRLPGLVADLVRLDVDVIVAANTPIAIAAKKASSRIPIVMAVGGDPVALGLVASLARPGGNVTGLSFGVGMQSLGKGLELLKEAVPAARRVAVLSNPTNPAHGLAVEHLKGVARSVGVQLQLLEARAPGEFERAFAMMGRERAEALLVVTDTMFGFNRARLQGLAARSGLPVMYGAREHSEAGGLMSYAVDIRDSFRRAATYVDKILKGARPADLPVEQPTKFELVINLKTAKGLGLTIPPALLARADHLIE